MGITRMFSNESAKGTRHYVKTQKVYEIARTVLYFTISLSLVIAGYIQTGTRINLLTIVGVLGCLPACKSLTEAILFLRFYSCSDETSDLVEASRNGVRTMYDCVFTTYKKCFSISCLSVRNNTVCGYAEDERLNIQEFYNHIGAVMRLDGLGEVTVKIFTDRDKYLARLAQMSQLEIDEDRTLLVTATLKSVML